MTGTEAEPAGVGMVGFWFLVLIGGVIPWAAQRSRSRLATAARPPKKRYLAGVIVQQLALTGLSVATAWSLGIPLFAPYFPTVGHWLAALGVLAMAMAVFLGWPEWRRQAARGDQRVQLIAPIDATDHALWTAVSVLAGIGEEITYRGVLFWIGYQMTGSAAASVAIAAAIFGVSHLVQGWPAVLVITGFAVVFHGLVMVTGSLYPAMVVHILYDLIAGVSYGRYVRALARSNSFMNSTNATTLERGQAL